jgi:hypothetical protein
MARSLIAHDSAGREIQSEAGRFYLLTADNLQVCLGAFNTLTEYLDYTGDRIGGWVVVEDGGAR